VVAIPLLGVLAYLPFSFKREDLPTAFLMKSGKGRQKDGNKRSSPASATGGRAG
jgi:hypothetical protein